MKFMTVREVANMLLQLPEDQQNLIFAYSDDLRYFGIPDSDLHEAPFVKADVGADGYDFVTSRLGSANHEYQTVLAVNTMETRCILSGANK